MKRKIDLRIVISQLLSLSTEPNFSSKKTKLAKKTSLIQILVESFGKFLLEKSLKEKPFFRNLVPDP
jgi:hypothetical protein